LVRTDLILEPEQYAETPAYKLLEAVAHGYAGVDHRWLHALVDNPERAIPDLLRFAAEDRADDRVDVDLVLLDVFRYLRTPAALPFFIQLVRRDPLNIEDELIEAFVDLGSRSVDPVLELLSETEKGGAGDVLFLLASLHVRDPRILEALIGRLDEAAWDGALALEIYGDPAAIPALEAALAHVLPGDSRTKEYIAAAIRYLSLGWTELDEPRAPYDIWDQYAEEDSPEFDTLDEEELLAMLERGSARLRAQVAASFHAEIPLRARARLLELAKSDPDLAVRQACWETLGEVNEEPEVRRAMLAVLTNPEASSQEKSGAAVGLAVQSDNPAVFETIEQLYQDPTTRAAALKAMARSMDRRFGAYPPKHLDDPDPEIQGQAIWAVGYLNLSSDAPRLEAFFKHPKHRTPALFAYALAIPGETSRAHIHALLAKIERVTGELDADEQELVRLALDQRLMLHGHKPVFFAEHSDEVAENEAPVVSSNPGRNDPCPCGSGKKYKKCCGA
jgi:SEC-C motif-containing protein